MWMWCSSVLVIWRASSLWGLTYRLTRWFLIPNSQSDMCEKQPTTERGNTATMRGHFESKLQISLWVFANWEQTNNLPFSRSAFHPYLFPCILVHQHRDWSRCSCSSMVDQNPKPVSARREECRLSLASRRESGELSTSNAIMPSTALVSSLQGSQPTMTVIHMTWSGLKLSIHGGWY